MIDNNTIFANSPGIKILANESEWTVSTLDKKPLDAVTLIKNINNNTLNIRNTKYYSNNLSYNTLVKLKDLDSIRLLNDTNRAIRQNAKKTHILIFDIEPNSNKATRQYLCHHLPIGYLEKSMNGGLHLVTYAPDEVFDNDTRFLLNKTVVRSPQKTFEVILNRHFITFTRQPIGINFWTDISKPYTATQIAKFKEVLQHLITFTNISGKIDIQKISKANFQDKLNEPLINYLINVIPDKKIQDFIETNTAKYDTDNSLKDYHMATSVIASMQTRLIRDYKDKKCNLELKKEMDNVQYIDFAVAAFEILVQILPYRKKYSTKRSGMPYLLYICVKASKYLTDQNKVKQTIKKRA